MKKILIGVSTLVMAATLFAECSKDSVAIQKAFGINQSLEEVKILDVKKTEYLDGFCTVALMLNGTNIEINYVNVKNNIVIGRGGVFKYKIVNDAPEIESLNEKESNNYSSEAENAIETKTLTYLNSKEFKESVYFKEVILKQINTKHDYSVFTFSSNSCGNCTTFKDFLKTANITYLYLPIGEEDYQTHKDDKYIEKNLEFANLLAQKLHVRLGTPTTLIYNSKAKQFVNFSIGANPKIIQKIEVIQKARG